MFLKLYSSPQGSQSRVYAAVLRTTATMPVLYIWSSNMRRANMDPVRPLYSHFPRFRRCERHANVRHAHAI